MALVIPTLESSPTFDAQAIGDATDLAAELAALQMTYVVSGCQVSQDTGSDMDVQVATGSYIIAGAPYSIAAASTGKVAIAAASSTDRKDIVVVAEQVTLNQTLTHGTNYTSMTVLATPTAIPSGATLIMSNGDNVTTSSPTSASATSISIVSYNPSGTITPSITTWWITPMWAVAGTACGTAGWSRATPNPYSNPPPVKPAIPTGTILVGEVYVANSTTGIVTGNIIDKTTLSSAVGTSATQTLINKRIQRRILPLTGNANSSGTGYTLASNVLTVDTDYFDGIHWQGITAGITINVTGGVPVDCDPFQIALTDNTSAQTVSMGSGFESIPGATELITTTPGGGIRLDTFYVYNTETNKWRYQGGVPGPTTLYTDLGTTNFTTLTNSPLTVMTLTGLSVGVWDAEVGMGLTALTGVAAGTVIVGAIQGGTATYSEANGAFTSTAGTLSGNPVGARWTIPVSTVGDDQNTISWRVILNVTAAGTATVQGWASVATPNVNVTAQDKTLSSYNVQITSARAVKIG